MDWKLPVALAKINKVYGVKFVIVIEEWDVIFREDKSDVKAQEAYITLLRGLFKDAPSKKFLKLAYMTGILPIKKYGTESALNNFDEFTMVMSDDIIEMLAGGKCKVNPQKFQNDMISFKSKDDILILLIHLGYLAYDMKNGEVSIPNVEVREEYKNAIEDTGWEHQCVIEGITKL